MSGASCGSGCTDCPTCQGEVHPDSPVMQDMDFAMAMATGPQATDRFMGPLSIAQTVRDAIGRRGAAGTGDSDVLSFINDNARPTDVPDGLPAQLAGPSFPWMVAEPPLELPEEPDVPIPMPEPELPELDAPRPNNPFVAGDFCFHSALRDPIYDSLGINRCCPDPINFPTIGPNATIDGPFNQPVPFLTIKKAIKVFILKIYYKGEFTFNNEPTPCLCRCCEIRQAIVKATFRIKGCASDSEAPPSEHEHEWPEEEDCGWWFVLVDENGNAQYRRDGRLYQWFQPGSCREAPEPWETPARVIMGPVRKGRRKPEPNQGYPPVPPPGLPPGWPPKEIPADPSCSGCKCELEDEVRRPVPAGCGFEFEWEVKLKIYDRCRQIYRRVAKFGFKVAGEANEKGTPVITEPPQKNKAVEK